MKAVLARLESQMATKEELRFEETRIVALEDDTKTNRRTTRAAMVAAVLALAGGLLLFLLEVVLGRVIGK